MNLSDYRRRIDELDAQVVRLLNERAKLAQQVGRLKDAEARETFAPDREQKVFHRLATLSEGPLEAAALRAVYLEIVSACRALERPVTVAYWGPPASNTHVAARRRFGAQTQFVCADSIADVFAAVEKGQADFGVVPVENSTQGIVSPTLDQFLDSDLQLCAEVFVPIEHHLLSNAESLAAVRRIYTMWQATAQCRGWLRAHLPDVDLVDTTTTARAAQIAAGEPDAAAIANSAAAEEYGLAILAERIEDSPRNRTRFWVVGRLSPSVTGRDKTSILFAVPHRAGALVEALACFERHDVSLTLIESRPTRQRPWEYYFFVDALGHAESQSEPAVAMALAELRERCLLVRVLGSYPADE